MKSLGGSECHDFQNYPSPHQELQSRFDSVFKGYFSDDVFWKSGKKQAVNMTKTRNAMILVKCKNIGNSGHIVENNQQKLDFIDHLLGIMIA